MRCIYIRIDGRGPRNVVVDVVPPIIFQRQAKLRYVYFVIPYPEFTHKRDEYHCYRLDPPGIDGTGRGSDPGLPDGVTEIGRFEGETIREAFLNATAENAHLVGENTIT